MKHFKQFLLAVLIVLTSGTKVHAYDFQVDGIFYNVLSIQDMTCEVTKGTYRYSGRVQIPFSVTYNGKSYYVTQIGNSAFNSCIDLTSVSIPNTVTSISQSAFAYSGLTEVNIPNSTIEIGISAFQDCDKLTNINFGNSVKYIGKWAFQHCTSFSHLKIPDSVVEIGESAFKNCSNLSYAEILNANTSIGKSAFQGCSKLSTLWIRNITSIEDYAFYDCSSLKSVKIPDTVTEIGEEAFRNCSNLTTAEISNSVMTINSYTFKDCTALSSVVIGKSVGRIEWGAFYGCSALKQITSLNPTPPQLNGNSAFRGISGTECTLRVPDESVDAYKAPGSYWNYFSKIIGINGGTGSGSSSSETEKCAKPTIYLVGDKIMALSTTNNAKCHTKITSEDFKEYDGNQPIDVSGIYTITSYAYAEGYENSETVTATLVWVNPTLEGSNIINMEAKKAVLIRSNGNSIVVSGTERGERIELYTIGGVLLNSVSANDNETVIPCNLQKGEIVIVKYGDRAIKCKL